jgi:radical SAM protein (TIGR01212 family)
VVGLAISTRPDCLPDDVIGVLAEFNGRMFMWVELGLQSANDEMLRLLNRGHAVSDFCEACARLRSKDISVCAHVILGLPGETEKDIAATAKLLNDLRIEGVKIHNLHVIKGTRLEELYNDGVIRLPSIAEYAKKVVYLLERLRPEMLIHRFNSHAPRQYTVAPAWSVNKLATFNEVERELERQETRQGRLFGGL